MLLTKRPFLLTGGLIFLLLLAMAVGGAVSADPANDPFGADVTDDWGWDSKQSGSVVGIDIFLTGDLAGQVFAVEVFLDPTTTDTVAAFTQTMGNPTTAFPTGQFLSFSFDAQGDGIPPSVRQNMTLPPVVTGLHLMGAADAQGNRTRVRQSGAPFNTGLLAPPAPTATPVQPTPTPVSTTVVPEDQVTRVSAPEGGASSVVQPNASTTVAAPDGSLSIMLPRTSYHTTYQVVYNPSPSNVPAAPSSRKVLRAFEVNAHDASGEAMSLSLINSATITVGYSAADVQAAFGTNPANLKVLAYNSATGTWSPLATTLDLAGQKVSARTSHFSLFALGSVEPAPQVVGTATPTPPETGGAAPGSTTLLAVLALGFVLVVGGGTYLLQARKPRG